MEAAKKITVIVPQKLLAEAIKATGKGITPTVNRGLELLSAAVAYKELRRMRGKVKFSMSWRQMKKDRL